MLRFILIVLCVFILMGTGFSGEIEKKFSAGLLGGVNVPVGELTDGWKTGFNFGGRGYYHLGKSSAVFLDIHYFNFSGDNSYYKTTTFFNIFAGYRTFLQKKASGFYFLIGAGVSFASDRTFRYGNYSFVSFSQEGGAQLGFMAGAGFLFPLVGRLNLLGEVKCVGNKGLRSGSDFLCYIPISVGTSIEI